MEYILNFIDLIEFEEILFWKTYLGMTVSHFQFNFVHRLLIIVDIALVELNRNNSHKNIFNSINYFNPWHTRGERGKIPSPSPTPQKGHEKRKRTREKMGKRKKGKIG